MANLVRKRDREPGMTTRGWDPFRTDPFQMMRDFMRWDPFREVESLGTLPARSFVPDVELKETKDAYVFKVDLPGIQEKDLDISVTGSQIHISGKREEEESQEEERYYAYERSYGMFTRSFTLPEGANCDEVAAELKNGVLSVRVPKRPEVQARHITVQGGEPSLEANVEQTSKKPAMSTEKEGSSKGKQSTAS